MDMPPFGLSQTRRHLLSAGIRHVLLDDSIIGVSSSINLTKLSSPWTEYLSRVPDNPKIIWSYWDLSADLSGAGDKKRSDFWRKLLGILNWPKGTIGFWPYTFYYHGTIEQDLDSFFLGLNLIKPLGVVLFVEAEKDEFSDKSNSEQLVSRCGLPLILAPASEILMHNSEGIIEPLVEKLRNFYDNLTNVP